MTAWQAPKDTCTGKEEYKRLNNTDILQYTKNDKSSEKALKQDKKTLLISVVGGFLPPPMPAYPVPQPEPGPEQPHWK